ncbi:MAG: ExbD/TolR family protein [Pseudomonadota bacterium]
MSEINVTPFVDVMLVLLIIFMVAAPLLTTGVPLDLPKTNAAALPTQEDEPLVLSIDADGVIYLQREPQAIDSLQEKLTAIREARGQDGDRVFFRADNTLTHGYVQRVLAILQNANFRRISFIHDQPRAE